MRALEALTKVNEAGSKDRTVVRKLARLRARLLAIVEEGQTEHTILLKAHAKRDDKGQMVPSADGRGVQVENETIFQLEVAGLEREQVDVADDLLLTDGDLVGLVEFPDANTLSVLLPVLTP